MVLLSYGFFSPPLLNVNHTAREKICVIKSLFDSLPPRRTKKKKKAPGRFRNIVHSRAPKAHITSYTHEKQMNIFSYSLGAKDGAMK